MHLLLRLSALAVLPGGLAAQELPPYIPANPVLASRSALYAQPIVAVHAGWRFRVATDYTNIIEASKSSDARSYLLDAEVLQSDLWVTRDLSPRAFVLANLSVRGGYDGSIDQILNFYHDLTGLQVPARKQRPDNTYAWNFALPDSLVTRGKPGTFLGDTRIGMGMRFGRAQLVGSVTLPTTTTDSGGWGREKVGTSLALTANLSRTSRWAVDGGVSAGWTPTNDDLTKYQRTSFVSMLASARWRFSGNQAFYSTFWMQSPNWKNTGLKPLDGSEVTLDFGALLHIKKNWPELQLGLTEDLVPRGPAIDAGFTLGVRW